MGRRLHVTTKRVVETKELPYLNYKADKFQDLLETLDCDVFVRANDDWESVEMEVSAEQFDEAVKRVNSPEAENDADLMDALKECEFDLSEARDCFKLCQDLSDTHEGLYYFEFF